MRAACGGMGRPHNPVAAAIVTAVLIGDRTGLPDEVRDAAPGGRHVSRHRHLRWATSPSSRGCARLLLLLGSGQARALGTIVALPRTPGRHVGRLGVARDADGLVYLTARLLDHRSPPWHALAVTAALVVCVRPLDVRRRRVHPDVRRDSRAARGCAPDLRPWPRPPPAGGVGDCSVAASLAAEVALLPVSALVFLSSDQCRSRAEPARGAFDGGRAGGGHRRRGLRRSQLDPGRPAGWVAHIAARRPR